jgi:hypothetical protein
MHLLREKDPVPCFSGFDPDLEHNRLELYGLKIYRN